MEIEKFVQPVGCGLLKRFRQRNDGFRQWKGMTGKTTSFCDIRRLIVNAKPGSQPVDRQSCPHALMRLRQSRRPIDVEYRNGLILRDDAHEMDFSFRNGQGFGQDKVCGQGTRRVGEVPGGGRLSVQFGMMPAETIASEETGGGLSDMRQVAQL